MPRLADYLDVSMSDVDVMMRAAGETNLPVPTADGVRQPANRVAIITITPETRVAPR